MFFNFLRVFVWGSGSLIVLFVGWAVYKSFNTPDYFAALFEKYPVKMTLKLIESDKYNEESVDMARTFIFSAFDSVANTDKLNEKRAKAFLENFWKVELYENPDLNVNIQRMPNDAKYNFVTGYRETELRPGSEKAFLHYTIDPKKTEVREAYIINETGFNFTYGSFDRFK